MTRSPWRGLVWVLAGGLAALGLAGTLVRRDVGSIERANRLYRDGRAEEAEAIYRARAESEAAPGTATYNLGTVLFARGANGAEEYLRLATAGNDLDAAQRAYYNLGYRFLTTPVNVAEMPDSAIGLLMGAIVTNRAALRLDPGHEDARWNLAFAQILLDSLLSTLNEDAPVMEEAEAPSDEGGILIPSVARSGRQRVEREALAGEDPGSLNLAEARALIDQVAVSPEALIRGFLWAHRPQVDPWAEPYPGGSR